MDERIENNTSFSQLVALRRNKMNMSLRKLAQEADVDVSYLSRLENSCTNINPSFQVVLKIAKALNISMQTLLEVFNFSKDEIGIVDDSNVINALLTDKAKKEKNLSRLGETSEAEKESMSEILVDLLQLRDRQMTDFKGISKLIQDIGELFKCSDKYCIITRTDDESFEVLRTPVFDERLKYLYLKAIGASESTCYIIEGKVINFPQQFGYAERSIKDLFDYWRYLEKEEFYDEISDYVNEFKEHYFDLIDNPNQ